MPNEKTNALEALDQARSLVGDGPLVSLSGVRLVQLRSFLEYARECVGAIEELKRARRNPAGPRTPRKNTRAQGELPKREADP